MKFKIFLKARRVKKGTGNFHSISSFSTSTFGKEEISSTISSSRFWERGNKKGKVEISSFSSPKRNPELSLEVFFKWRYIHRVQKTKLRLTFWNSNQVLLFDLLFGIWRYCCFSEIFSHLAEAVTRF